MQNYQACVSYKLCSLTQAILACLEGKALQKDEGQLSLFFEDELCRTSRLVLVVNSALTQAILASLEHKALHCYETNLMS